MMHWNSADVLKSVLEHLSKSLLCVRSRLDTHESETYEHLNHPVGKSRPVHPSTFQWSAELLWPPGAYPVSWSASIPPGRWWNPCFPSEVHKDNPQVRLKFKLGCMKSASLYQPPLAPTSGNYIVKMSKELTIRSRSQTRQWTLKYDLGGGSGSRERAEVPQFQFDSGFLHHTLPHAWCSSIWLKAHLENRRNLQWVPVCAGNGGLSVWLSWWLQSSHLITSPLSSHSEVWRPHCEWINPFSLSLQIVVLAFLSSIWTCRILFQGFLILYWVSHPCEASKNS